MVKYWEVKEKVVFLNKINETLMQFNCPAIPVLKLFKKLVDDQKEKTRYSMTTNTKFTSTGRAVTSFSHSNIGTEPPTEN